MDTSSNLSSSNNTDATPTAKTGSPATTYGYPGDYAGLSTEDKAKWQQLYENVSVINVNHCSAHSHLYACNCTGQRAMSAAELHGTKVDNFIPLWDQRLYFPQYCAYDYDGTQASHHALQAKNNSQTPKHFARAFVQQHTIGVRFAASGRLQDLVKAMVEFWVMRTTMWKAKYGSAGEVHQKWMAETYDMSNTSKMSFRGIHDLVSARPGDALSLHGATVGPPDHQCKIFFLHLDKLRHGSAFKVAKTELCHVNCPTMEQLGVTRIYRQAVQDDI